MKIEYDIIPDDQDVSFLGDTITISVESGNPGGDRGEFQEHMLEALKEWYDGYKVRLVSIRPWKS